MAFNTSGAATGAMSGASAGSAFGPWGTAIGGVAGGLAGGFLGGDAEGPDIGQMRADIGRYGNAALGNINQGYDQGLGTLQNFRGGLQPGYNAYLDYAGQGGGANALQGLADQFGAYQGPDVNQLNQDPYTAFRLQNSARDTRAAQSARGGLGLFSSAGVGQEARLQDQIRGEGYRYREGQDLNRMQGQFGMQSQAEQARMGALSRLGSQYGNVTGQLSQGQIGRGQNLGSINQWMGAGLANAEAGAPTSPEGRYLQSLQSGMSELGGALDPLNQQTRQYVGDWMQKQSGGGGGAVFNQNNGGGFGTTDYLGR
jgi:hypothetical protein